MVKNQKPKLSQHVLAIPSRLSLHPLTGGLTLLSPLGRGDTTFHQDFLTDEEATQIFDALYEDIEWQLWHHMPDKKPKRLKPLSRVKVSMADEVTLEDEDGTWMAHYRFPVNNQSAHKIYSIKANPHIQMIVNLASERVGHRFNHVVVLLYRNGHDCIGAHKDKVTDLDPEAPICSVSLGAERPYVLRTSPFPSQSTDSQKLILRRGGLLILGPQTNQEYYHSVPKLEVNSPSLATDGLDSHSLPSKSSGPRISITMRKVTTFRNIETGALKGRGEAYVTHDWPTELRGVHVPYKGFVDIMTFWFGHDMATWNSPLWWHGNSTSHGLKTLADTDAYIRDRWGFLLSYFEKPVDLFEDDHVLKPWFATTHGILGALILFDQFPRHIFRYQEKAFAFDHYALSIAKHLMETDYSDLPLTSQVFVNVAYMHAEDEAYVSDASLNLMRLSLKVEKDDPLKKELRKMSKVAEDHLKMLKRFGRYCHRNHALGRESTEEEIAYLGGKYLPKWVQSSLDPSAIPVLPKAETPLGTKLKLLVLHSNRQNAEGFQRKTRNALERRLSPIADLHYCNAPHPYTPSGEAKDTLNQLEVPTSSGIYCWWNASDDPETMVYTGLEDSVAFVNGLFKTHDFDGIVGFSQGGTLTGFLSLLVNQARKGFQGHPRPGEGFDGSFDVSSLVSKLKFVVCISGFPVRDVRFGEQVKDASIDIPSFHSWGLEDTLVDPWRSEALSQMFVDPQIMVHRSSHFRRAIKYWPIDQIAKWMETFMDRSSTSESLCDLAKDVMNSEESMKNFIDSSSSRNLEGMLRYLITSGLYSADSILTFLTKI